MAKQSWNEPHYTSLVSVFGSPQTGTSALMPLREEASECQLFFVLDLTKDPYVLAHFHHPILSTISPEFIGPCSGGRRTFVVQFL